MATITATYSTKHTTGASTWDLEQLGVDPNAIEDYDIKWDKLTIWFKDEDLEEEEYFPTHAVVVFDDVNGHEWIKHPEEIITDLEISV
jgi:hypothetical protein